MRALLLAGAGTVAGAAVALRRTRNWGASALENVSTLPGDELIPDPADLTTMAVDIDAPAHRVWPWLVQMGQDRGGMYSYDWLETVFGLRIHSVYRVHERWQHLAVGDRIELVPKGWGPLPAGYALTVARIEPGRALVLRQEPPEHPWNAVWTFVLEPLDASSCRLLSRTRAQRPAGVGLRLANAVLEPVTTLMTRRMLLGIKQRAESEVVSYEPEPARPVEDVAPAPGVLS